MNDHVEPNGGGSELFTIPESVPFERLVTPSPEVVTRLSKTDPIVLEMRIEVNAEASVAEFVDAEGNLHWALELQSGAVKEGVTYLLLQASSQL